VLTVQLAVVLQSAKYQHPLLSIKVQVSTQPTTVQDQALPTSRTIARRVVQAMSQTLIHRVHLLPTHRHRLLPTRRHRLLPTHRHRLLPPKAVTDPVTRMAPEATLTKVPSDNAFRNSTGQPSLCQRLR
jgi:hypothetical protein